MPSNTQPPSKSSAPSFGSGVVKWPLIVSMLLLGVPILAYLFFWSPNLVNLLFLIMLMLPTMIGALLAGYILSRYGISPNTGSYVLPLCGMVLPAAVYFIYLYTRIMALPCLDMHPPISACGSWSYFLSHTRFIPETEWKKLVLTPWTMFLIYSATSLPLGFFFGWKRGERTSALPPEPERETDLSAQNVSEPLVASPPPPPVRPPPQQKKRAARQKPKK